MNTEIIEYFKQLSKKEFFWTNFINMVLGILIILLGLAGLMEGVTVMAYGFMFLAGAVMMFLNFNKGLKKGNMNTWIFLVAGIGCSVMSVLFFTRL